MPDETRPIPTIEREQHMKTVTDAYGRLMERDWSELQELLLACSEAHASMCIAASEDVDRHAPVETMRLRIADMSKERVARTLAPFALLGGFWQISGRLEA